jgi:hypothetical protein
MKFIEGLTALQRSLKVCMIYCTSIIVITHNKFLHPANSSPT